MATAFEVISDTTLTSAAASISASVSTDYRRFRLTLYVVKDGTGGVVTVRLNADAGANYTRQRLTANGATPSGARDSTTFFNTQSSNTDANASGLLTLEVSKPLTTTAGRLTASNGYMASAGVILDELVAEWSNTSDLISSIDLSVSAGNFAAGTRLLVEGAKP